ncbi:MAG: hypothetical protein Q9170_004524 [Blastenia crenularia]
MTAKDIDAYRGLGKDMDSSSTKSTLRMGSITHDISEVNLKEACTDFAAILGSDCILSDNEVLRAHSSTPWSPASLSQIPALVVTPKSTSEVSEIMKICSRRRIPVIAYSGGTSFAGALTATRGGICIDFKKMDEILVVHEKDLDVVVQPAVGWQDLNEYLEPRGFFFPPDPGAGARIGGMVGIAPKMDTWTNAYRHGTMKDWVTSMTAVLADGTIVKTRHRPRKSSAGYDLTSLLVGSEGTLGLVTEAVLKITSVPENQNVGLAAFSTTHAAVDTAVALITSGLPIDALELLDSYALVAINQSGLSERRWREKPTLFLRFSGSRQAVQDQISMAQQAARTNSCESFETTGEKSEMQIIWSGRKDVARCLAAMKANPSDLFLSADAAVPISCLAEMIDWSLKIIQDAGFAGYTVGHVGDGNYHASIVCPKDQENKALSIINEIQRRAIRLEGTITGEHGIGLKWRDMLVEEVGDNGVDMMRAVGASVTSMVPGVWYS